MAENNEEITYFGETDFRGKKTPFGIKKRDRARHVYVIGKTGMGKSTALENMAVQDIKNGNGMAFIDPHGGSAEKLLEYVPKERIKDVIYFAPHDLEHPISFNVMEGVNKDQRHLVANGLMAAFKKIWPDVWSARMEYISNNILLALLEYPDSTLLGVNRMLSDKVFRKKVVDNITDPSVKSFWVDEFAKYTEKLMTEAGASIQNKFGQFTANPLIRNLIGQTKSTFDIRDIMDNKKIFIVNLSKGRMGEMNSNLIGGMLITKIYLAAMSRANTSESELKKLPNFYLYVDEFQSFVNDSFADILSEARKYKLNLTIAHQYIEQMPETVRNAVFGNVGTTIAFRVGPFDAEVLEKVFSPKFTAEDIVNLGFAQIYLSLMIDGVGSTPFSATTLSPIAKLEKTYVNEVVDNSRKTYARPREEVENDIKKWYESGNEVAGASTDFKPKTESAEKKYVPKETFVPKKDFIPAPAPKPVASFSEAVKRADYLDKTPRSFSKQQFVSNTPKTAPAPVLSKPAWSVPVTGPSPRIDHNYKKQDTFKKSEPMAVVPAPQKMSLSDLSKKEDVPIGDKKYTGNNLGGLKAALAEAVSSKKSDFSFEKDEKDEERITALKNLAKEPPVENTERELIDESAEPVSVSPKQNIQINIHQQSKVQSQRNFKPQNFVKKSDVKEVPEDVLRKILDTKKFEDKMKNSGIQGGAQGGLK